MLIRVVCLLVAGAAVAARASASAPSPPCYTPLNPNLETLCYTTSSTAGNVSVRIIGAGVDGVLVTGMSAETNFSTGSLASAVPVFEYFLSDNDSFKKIPLAVPLIFRPSPAGTWLSSFALPTSVYASASAAPGIIPNTDARFEEFSGSPGSPGSGRMIAAYTFYTINVAVERDYVSACTVLESALAGMGLTPVAGAWREAWVAYSPEAMVGDMTQECWIEVQSA